eukprot:2676812-Pleurochrysis_carterae.AAC.3
MAASHGARLLEAFSPLQTKISMFMAGFVRLLNRTCIDTMAHFRSSRFRSSTMARFCCVHCDPCARRQNQTRISWRGKYKCCALLAVRAVHPVATVAFECYDMGTDGGICHQPCASCSQKTLSLTRAYVLSQCVVAQQ